MSETPAAAPAPPLVLPEGIQRFGKYFLLRKLAQGGMAEIFLAKNLGPDGFERNVVIKRMLKALTDNPDFVQMFRDEARLAARLAHPNIVPIHELGLEDGAYYICMEYLAGEDFSSVMRVLRRQGELYVPMEVAARIVLEAAQGLQYAHDFTDDDGEPLNVVHRDVSPSNILITYQGQVKLVDFGIARARSHVGTTREGTFKGKYLFMAPEQATAQPIDGRADIFALGLCFYEALTNVRPFHKESVNDTLRAVLDCDIPPPRSVRPDLPEEVEHILVRSLGKIPAQRYPTAMAMALDSERFLAGRGQPVERKALSAFLYNTFGQERAAHRVRIPTLASLARQGLYVPGFTDPSVPMAVLPQSATPTPAPHPPVTHDVDLDAEARAPAWRGWVTGATALARRAKAQVALQRARLSPRQSAVLGTALAVVIVAVAIASTRVGRDDDEPSVPVSTAPPPPAVAEPAPPPGPDPEEPAPAAAPAPPPPPHAAATTAVLEDDPAPPAPPKPPPAPRPRVVKPPVAEPVAPATPLAPVDLTDEEIQRVLSSNRPQIMACISSSENLPAEGDITIELSIRTSGAVAGPRVRGPLRGTAAASCIEQKLMAIRFPPSKETVVFETSFHYRARR